MMPSQARPGIRSRSESCARTGPYRRALALAGCLLTAAAGAWTEAHAAAASQRCVVPKISVCDGCLRKVIVTARANGICRVTFEVSASAFRTSGPDDTVPIEVALDGRAPFVRRAAAIPQAPIRAPSAPCFVFNGTRYCE